MEDFTWDFCRNFQWLCDKLPEGKRNNGDKPMDFRMLYLVFDMALI